MEGSLGSVVVRGSVRVKPCWPLVGAHSPQDFATGGHSPLDFAVSSGVRAARHYHHCRRHLSVTPSVAASAPRQLPFPVSSAVHSGSPLSPSKTLSTACHRGCVFLLPNYWPVSWRAPAGWPRDPLGLGYHWFLKIPWPLSSHSMLQGPSNQSSPVAPGRPHTLRASTAIPHRVRFPVRRVLPEESVLAGGRGDKE